MRFCAQRPFAGWIVSNPSLPDCGRFARHSQSAGRASSSVSASALGGNFVLVKPIRRGRLAGKMPAAAFRLVRDPSVPDGPVYRKFSTRMMSLCNASSCVYRIVFLSGEIANPGAPQAGPFSRSNTRVIRWVAMSKKLIPGCAVVSR
jgi:hypothetical protein